jgi:hypothetical protein
MAPIRWGAVTMRLKPKLSMVSGIGRPATAISDAAWRSIQSKYGHQLSPDVRKRMCDETQKFIRIADLEAKAEPLETVKRRLSKLQGVASGFTSELVKQMKGNDEALYGLRLIEAHFVDPRVPVDTDKLEFIAGIMASFKLACRSAEDEIINGKSLGMGMRYGVAWNQWISALIAIARDHGLPCGIRKDSDKQKPDTPSPFVILVRELQTCIPDEHRRSTQSDAALATAISKARVSMTDAKSP